MLLSSIACQNTNVEYDGQRDETLSENIFDFAIDDAYNYTRSNCSQDECFEISIGQEVLFKIQGDYWCMDSF